MKKPAVFDREEFKIFKKLSTPSKVQDFLDAIPMNFEEEGDTLRSPRSVLRENRAHCLEAAFLAAAIFWYQGEKPLLLDLQAARDDFDHVVTLFKRDGYWGAVSKTNHAVLRYRDPVYKSVRELAMSYFNEYFLDTGRKTMTAFSKPFDLRKYNPEWIISEDYLWDIGDALDDSFHEPIVKNVKAKKFRLADPVEIEAGKITVWEESKKPR